MCVRVQVYDLPFISPGSGSSTEVSNLAMFYARLLQKSHVGFVLHCTACLAAEANVKVYRHIFAQVRLHHKKQLVSK